MVAKQYWYRVAQADEQLDGLHHLLGLALDI